MLFRWDARPSGPPLPAPPRIPVFRRPLPMPTMATSHVPLRVPRLATLALSFVFGVVGFALGVRALVKSMDDKDDLRARAPRGTTVNINTNGTPLYVYLFSQPPDIYLMVVDVLDAGYVLTAGCGLLSVLSLAFLALPARLAIRTLPIQTALLAFTTIWILATAIPVTLFTANRSAKVTAFLGGTQLPDSVVQATMKALGVSGKYKDLEYRAFTLS